MKIFHRTNQRLCSITAGFPAISEGQVAKVFGNTRIRVKRSAVIGRFGNSLIYRLRSPKISPKLGCFFFEPFDGHYFRRHFCDPFSYPSHQITDILLSSIISSRK